MENLNPTLHLLLCARRALEKNQVVRIGIDRFLHESRSPFATTVAHWLSSLQKSQTDPIHRLRINPLQKALLNLLQRGLKGESIYQQLVSLEEEVLEACQIEIQAFLLKLPVLMLIPMLLFQFPAFMILLFGPIVGQILTALNGH